MTQKLSSKSNSEIDHNLEEIDLREKNKRVYTRHIQDDLIYLEADPKIKILSEISPNSASHLATVFHQLVSFLKKSIGREFIKGVEL